MDLPENKSSKSKVTWIIVGVVVALIVLGGSIYAIIMAAMPRQATDADKGPVKTREITNEQLRSGLDEFNATMKREETDRKAAQSAFDDTKRIKLSN